jgi:MoxR-like ATPase
METDLSLPLESLRAGMADQVIGQPGLIDSLLIALVADGHLLVQGAPGLAKTRAVKTLADAIEGSFQRIQFTPDLLPADIVGTEIYRTNDQKFEFEPGPVFNHFILADEINRAPAKVQSALLEAMQERQVSVGRRTMSLPTPFLVMATQNPIEQEGTYPLPEAQLDRFLMQVQVGYPDANAERAIINLARAEATKTAAPVTPVLSIDQINQARTDASAVHMSESVEQYLVQLVLATRDAARYSQPLASWIELGASPRASIALDRCSRARAWLNGRDFVTPDDIQALAHDCLRHRIALSIDALAEGISADSVVDGLLEQVPVT